MESLLDTPTKEESLLYELVDTLIGTARLILYTEFTSLQSLRKYILERQKYITSLKNEIGDNFPVTQPTYHYISVAISTLLNIDPKATLDTIQYECTDILDYLSPHEPLDEED